MSDSIESPPLIVVDFSSLPLKDLNYMVRQVVIGRPLLIRNLMALKRCGFQEIAVQYRIEQDTLRRDLARHPILARMLAWYPSTKNKPMNPEMLKRVASSGCYWMHPLFFANRRLLAAFEKARLLEPAAPFVDST